MTRAAPRRLRPPRRTLALAVLALVAVAAVAGCGDDEEADACAADAAVLEVPHVIPTEPAVGAVVGETFTVRGCSRTFESSIQWRLSEPAGAELARGFAMGGGVDGSAAFEFTVFAPVTEPTLAQLRVFEADVSEGRGSPPPQAVIPLLLSP